MALTTDPIGISTDPAVLSRRLQALMNHQDDIIAGRSKFGRGFADKADAKAAAGRGQVVIELHGLGLFFLSPPSL